MLAVGWGVSVEAFLADHPDARLERQSADLSVYSLTQAVGDTGVTVSSRWTFSLDELVAADLTCPGGAPDFTVVASAIARLAPRPPDPLEVGLQGLVVGRTRVTVDHLDGKIRLEEEA